MDSYFFRQLLQNEILKNATAICFWIKKLLITSDLKQTYFFLAMFLNQNSYRKSRWLFLISFLFSRLNNMTDFNLWLLSSRLRHWPTYFHEIFFLFLIKRFSEKKSVNSLLSLNAEIVPSRWWLLLLPSLIRYQVTYLSHNGLKLFLKKHS